MKTIVYDRYKNYAKDHCWQFDIRSKNLEEDLKISGLTKEEASQLKVSDFVFEYVDKDDKSKCDEIIEFIHKYEWLSTMPLRPTHRFTARYKGKLAGVVVMAIPNTFSTILGEDKKDLEKLISRGACISWSPKGLGSSLIMWSIKYMVQNTQFRLFTAYSDPEAKELGTIYQACNFIYLGKTSGAQKLYYDPKTPQAGWFSDRTFRKIGKYKKYAKQLGIKWNDDWNDGWKIKWQKMPTSVKLTLKKAAKDYQASCESREVPSKHKYCYILGRDRRETKQLVKLFRELNPNKLDLPYPKKRGD